MSLGMLFNSPFRESTPLSSGLASIYPVVIDGVGYQVDLTKQYVRRSMDIMAARQNRREGMEALVPSDMWWYLEESWHLGAGQAAADRAESAQYRYRDSLGIDPWTRWELSLLPDTTLIHPFGTQQGRVRLAVIGVVNPDDVTYTWRLVAVAGSTSYWTLDGLAWDSQAHASPVVDVACDGAAVFTLHADGTVYRSDDVGSESLWATVPGGEFIAVSKGHVIVSANNILYDVTGHPSDLADAVVYTHPNTSFRWRAATDGQSVIYLLGGVGDQWVVHRMGLSPGEVNGVTTDVLDVPVVAGTLPDGEVGRSLASYLGFLAVGTGRGLRIAVADGAGDLTVGPLIPVANGPVFDFEGQDRFIWFTNTDPVSGFTGLGRMDLTKFIQPLAPAYANDLMVSGTGAVTDVVTFLGKRVFSVYGQGVFMESDDLVPSGWLTTGDITFGVIDKKTGLYAQMRHYPLQGRVSMEMSTDASDWSEVYTSAQQGSMGWDNQYLDGRVFARCEMRLTLYRSADRPTEGPRMTRWEVRVFPNAGRASEWLIPVILYDAVDADGVVFERDPRKDLQHLIGLCESGRIFTYREGDQGWQVSAQDYEWRPERRSTRQGWQGVCTIRLAEVR